MIPPINTATTPLLCYHYLPPPPPPLCFTVGIVVLGFELCLACTTACNDCHPPKYRISLHLGK